MENIKKVLITIVLLGLAVAVCIMSYRAVCDLANGFFGEPVVESVEE